MWVKKRSKIFFEVLMIMKIAFPKLDLLLFGLNGHLKFIGKFIMINSALTHSNFFVLRLRDPNPFDSEKMDVGSSCN